MDAGAFVNAAGRYDETVMMQAARNGHIDIVRLLLKNGADSHLKNIRGKTATDVADEWDYADTAEFIRV
ncbi:MAG: ankyrin repeat domain-containing protein [Methylohalobius sp.]